MVLTLRSPIGTRLVSVAADLIGDGEPGWTIETTSDAKRVRGIEYEGTKRGTFNLTLTVTDANGCVGTTGLRRDVRVQ